MCPYLLSEMINVASHVTLLARSGHGEFHFWYKSIEN